MSSTSRFGWLLAASLCWLVAAGSAQTAPIYDVQFLGEALGVTALNESGRCIGSTSTGGTIRGWVADADAGLALLPLPPGMASSYANDLNEAGVIVGAVSPSSSPEFSGEAAAWIPDGSGGYIVQMLGRLTGHVISNATALNNVGDIVGMSGNGTFRFAVLFSLSGASQDLSPTGVFDPSAINDERVLVDQSFSVKRMDLDTMIAEDLGVPFGLPSTYLGTRSAAINATGQVAGTATLTTSTSCSRQSARYTDGVGWEILSSCGSGNGAVDINDLGDVVMRLNIAPYVRLTGLGTFRIEDLIDHQLGHWFVLNSSALAINGSRQMALAATNQVTGETGVVLLTLQAEGAWDDRGHALSGSTGVPELLGTGDLTAGSPVSIDLTNAASTTPAFLLLGLSELNFSPFFGGTLVPDFTTPPGQIIVLATDGSGEVALGAAWPFGVPSGFEFYLQYWIEDAGGPFGYAASNAVRGTTP